MGTSEEGTPSKPSKPASSTQEVPSTPFPDWSTSMQAYYGAGGTPFFPSPVASPGPHPYMWGPQQPLMPPYGTPVPYPAMYPPGGVYAHPTMPMMAHSPAPANIEAVKDKASGRESKGNSKGKGGGGGSENDSVSKSNDSASEGSSDGTDDNANQQEQGSSRKGSFGQMLADANSQGKTSGSIQGSFPGKPVAPATNLNIGMDLWSSAGGAAKMRPNTSGAGVPVPVVTSEQWIQDERELKRQKRKQSNRESARRSRLRKQAECEQLQQRVDSLTNENQGLREELRRLSDECEKLTSENNTIKDELTRLCGPEAVANLEQSANSATDPKGDEGNNKP